MKLVSKPSVWKRRKITRVHKYLLYDLDGVLQCVGDEIANTSSEFTWYFIPRDGSHMSSKRSRGNIHPGGLPLELWFLILEAIDEPNTLTACGLTCKVLAARVTDMLLVCRQLYTTYADANSFLNIDQLSHHLTQSVLIGQLIRDILIAASSLPNFGNHFANKLRQLRIICIFGSGRTLASLRTPSFVLLS
ncbi:hypothetical protein OBBRIDRAFT_134973 [Obba rivulosa]|uniref:F-box domain-containing protein n=1 Tax=Obba rivulosa TaxID=1052685 RepID=A0A8E2ASX3_9APHY|nr:hypothetical protein OBBRIDRAFT_134973 [Obba rivulosa]